MIAAVEVAAPAKINLRLRVLGREASGYHGLETLFCAVDLADSLRLSHAGPGIELEVAGGVDTGPAEENLAVRAARRFYAELGEAPRLRIELEKRIPAAAGLGGGSSDAAATLRGLNALHGEPFPLALLRQWGSELGSDVAFFLCGSSFALAWSRGERLLLLPSPPPRSVIIAHPGEAMPTAAAFARIAELRGGDYRPEALALSLAELGSWEAIARYALNDFQPAADEAVPRLASARRLLLDAGAEIALLAGSGASLFGVFPEAAASAAAAPPLRDLGFEVWQTRTLGSFPPPRSYP